MSLCVTHNCPGDITRKGRCSHPDCSNPDNPPRTGEFSVAQFFEDGTNEYVRRFVSADEAWSAFGHYCQSIGAKMGMVARVVITDGLDFTNMEWKRGEGIVFPEDLKGTWK